MNKVFRAELSERAYIMSGTHTGEKINANSTYTDPGMERGGPNYNDGELFAIFQFNDAPKNMKIEDMQDKHRVYPGDGILKCDCNHLFNNFFYLINL